MSIFKKIISLLLSFSMIFMLCACSQSAEKADDKLSIICTVFPEYDWVKNILGDRIGDVDLTLLLDTGVDLHNYQPTVEDLAKISACDMFVYVGGESDSWVSDALKNAASGDIVTVNLLDELESSVKEEEVKEGMQQEDGGSGEKEYDEHVWLSLKNAEKLCGSLSEAIQSADPENADIYKANAESYISSLEELDGRYEDVCSSGRTKSLVFGDRFPFRYMTDDYGLDYYAAFTGCSAETEASFETIKFLAGKVDELGLKSVMTIEGTDHRIAETIVDNTKNKNQQILSLNSMQGITADDVENGADYLGIMESNLSVLQKALEV